MGSNGLAELVQRRLLTNAVGVLAALGGKGWQWQCAGSGFGFRYRYARRQHNRVGRCASGQHLLDEGTPTQSWRARSRRGSIGRVTVVSVGAGG